MKAEQRKVLMIFLSDNGGEYKNGAEAYCNAEGIQHVFACPYTRQQNGVSGENINRTLTEKATAVRLAARLPREYWF